jgi:hypothetical protein
MAIAVRKTTPDNSPNSEFDDWHRLKNREAKKIILAFLRNQD